jgi:hypothetical protein
MIQMLGEDMSSSSIDISHLKKFYNPGSMISLKCIIRCHLIKNATIQDITNVSWKRNKVLFDLHEQERIRKVKKNPKHICKIILIAAWECLCPATNLLIPNAVLEDAGLYSCTLPALEYKDFPRAWVMVHIIYGKNYYLVEFCITQSLYQGTS